MSGHKVDRFPYLSSCLICTLLIILAGIMGCGAIFSTNVEGQQGEKGRHVKKIAENEEAVSNLLKIMVHINEKFPGPTVPENDESYSVIAITDASEFILDDGSKIALAGISCSGSAAKEVRALFTSSRDKIRFEKTRGTDDSRASAYVWLVDYDFEKAPTPENVGFGPAFLSINETALLEGWCSPSQDVEQKFYRRFRILSELGIWSRQGGENLPTIQ